MTKTVSIAAIIAVIVGALAGFLAGRVQLGSKRVAYATILLAGSPGQCRAKVFPEVLEVPKNWDIDWTVADLCGDTANAPVEIRWIDRPDSRPQVGNNPLEGPASDRKRFKRALKNGLRVGDKFRYQVWLNGVLLVDPDVEIVQF